MWCHPLAAMLALLGMIPVGSVLLHTDPGGSTVPPGAAGGEVHGRTVHTYKHYLMKDCSYLYKETHLDLNESSHFFKGVDEDFAFYREFLCTNEVIQSVDRDYDSETAPVIESAYWINGVWSDLHLKGQCVPTTKGGLRFEPPLSEEDFSYLPGCLTTNEYLVNTYDDLYCSSSLPSTMQSMRIHGTSDCIDTVVADGTRRGQKYECLNHALVELKYGDYLECNEKSLGDKEDVWTYERWKLWVTGQCVSFDNIWSAKMSYQVLTDEAIQAMEATECGNPMAELVLYTAPGCGNRNILLIQELVAENEDCVYMTSHRARRSVKLTKACGEDFYGLFAYLNDRCSFIPYWAVKLTEEEHTRFRAEECIETSEIYAGIPVYFKLRIRNKDSPPFQSSLNTCTTATTATTATTTTELPPENKFPSQEPVQSPPEWGPDMKPPEWDPPPEWPPEWKPPDVDPPAE